MIAISPRPVGKKWNTISFASTLYLCPILDLLLSGVPSRWHDELRLGLQEALVNAATHGNKLDPSKKIWVRFSIVDRQYWWIISDQGSGFEPRCCCRINQQDELPDDESECGRGLFLLYQIFDRVEWTNNGRELQLCKCLDSGDRLA